MSSIQSNEKEQEKDGNRKRQVVVLMRGTDWRDNQDVFHSSCISLPTTQQPVKGNNGRSQRVEKRRKGKESGSMNRVHFTHLLSFNRIVSILFPSINLLSYSSVLFSILFLVSSYSSLPPPPLSPSLSLSSPDSLPFLRVSDRTNFDVSSSLLSS